VQSCIILFPFPFCLFLLYSRYSGFVDVVVIETKNKSSLVRRRGFQRGTHEVCTYPFVRNVVCASRDVQRQSNQSDVASCRSFDLLVSRRFQLLHSTSNLLAPNPFTPQCATAHRRQYIDSTRLDTISRHH
jgi:hypothetical protein